MLIGGAALIAVAYALIKYLEQPRFGFSDEKSYDENSFAKQQVESLVIAENFTKPTPPTAAESAVNFGGGTGGGGGAGGEY